MRWRRPAVIDELGSLRRCRVLLLGFGAIGKAIAQLLQPFDVTLVAIASRARTENGQPVVTDAQLDEFLPQSDVVFVAMPLSPQTRHMLDARRLALLPSDAILVNVARADLIEEQALVSALRAGRCRAALDVFNSEPLPAGHPLWTLDNVILTPHVAGFGETDLAQHLAQACLDNMLDVIAGARPRDAVQAAQLPPAEGSQ